MTFSHTIFHARALLMAVSFSGLLLACSDADDPVDAGIRGVSFVGITVEDVARSSEFYAGAANMQVVEDYDPGSAAPFLELLEVDDVQIESALLRSSNAQLRLMEFEPRAGGDWQAVPVQGPGIAHVCVQANKATGSYERFLSLGAGHMGAREMVQLNPRNPVEYAYVYDLEGAVLEIEHVDVAALELPEPPPNDYRIRQVAFSTPDIEVLTAFYSSLLGGQESRDLGHWFGLSGENFELVAGLPGVKLKMSWLQTRNLELEFVQYVSHPTTIPDTPRPLHAPGYNMVVFDVADIDQARKALLAAGGSLVEESLALDGGEILFGRDPDGNLIGFQVVADDAAVSSQNFANNGL